jgi:Family of unknown function (DUF6580)
MNETRRQTLSDLLVFTLLIGIGVAGRWGQPAWCFTPTAAAAIFAGRYFSRLSVAALVPIAILAISDLRLPAYDNWQVLVATYSVMAMPVLLGRWLRTSKLTWRSAWRWALCGLLPAVLFFAITNFAVWAFQSDYEPTLGGLTRCYVAAVPFFRAMLAGDFLYLAVLAGCWAAAGWPVARQTRLAPQTASLG